LKGSSDADTIEEMVNIGKKLLEEYEPGLNAKYCFHVPPFNSVDHLHLHCIAPVEEMTWLGRLKYYEGSFYCQSALKIIDFLRNNDNTLKNENCGEVKSLGSKFHTDNSLKTACSKSKL